MNRPLRDLVSMYDIRANLGVYLIVLCKKVYG